MTNDAKTMFDEWYESIGVVVPEIEDAFNAGRCCERNARQIEWPSELFETLRNADNEGTESPYWLLIDPAGKNMKTTVCDIAPCINGPFFCREDAENYLKARRYAYSDRARVWCASGYHSQKYKNFYRALKSQVKLSPQREVSEADLTIMATERLLAADKYRYGYAPNGREISDVLETYTHCFKLGFRECAELFGIKIKGEGE